MKLKTDLVVRNIVGEYIAIPVGKNAASINGMISLTPSGELLIRKLQEGCEVEDLVQCLLDRYDVDRQTVQRDVELFLDKLTEQGLL